MTTNRAWDTVKRARHPKRITASDVIDTLFKDVTVMQGDRLFGDDPAIIGAIATFKGTPVTVIAEEKGHGTEERIGHNFGMPHPEGYRKAVRLMRQAEKFKRPVITIIDTPGAYPGVDAESRGQARAIADNLMVMSGLSVPVIAVILGEGGSGGALAIGVADRILMFEHAIYSVVSPEGYASIVFRDASRADEASALMKLTAQDLSGFGVIDVIIKEGPGLETDPREGMSNLEAALDAALSELIAIPADTLVSRRDEKYRAIGAHTIHEHDKDNDI